jgi:hypothetical protein
VPLPEPLDPDPEPLDPEPEPEPEPAVEPEPVEPPEPLGSGEPADPVGPLEFAPVDPAPLEPVPVDPVPVGPADPAAPVEPRVRGGLGLTGAGASITRCMEIETAGISPSDEARTVSERPRIGMRTRTRSRRWAFRRAVRRLTLPMRRFTGPAASLRESIETTTSNRPAEGTYSCRTTVDRDAVRAPPLPGAAATRAFAAAGAMATRSTSAPRNPSFDLRACIHRGSARTLSRATKPAQVGLVYERAAARPRAASGSPRRGRGSTASAAGRSTDAWGVFHPRRGDVSTGDPPDSRPSLVVG